MRPNLVAIDPDPEAILTLVRGERGENFTDTSNAERFARKLPVRYDNCAPQRTLVCPGAAERWEPDQTGEILQRTKAIARDLYECAARIENADERRKCVDWARKSESADRRKAALFLAPRPSQASQFYQVRLRRHIFVRYLIFERRTGPST